MATPPNNQSAQKLNFIPANPTSSLPIPDSDYRLANMRSQSALSSLLRQNNNLFPLLTFARSNRMVIDPSSLPTATASQIVDDSQQVNNLINRVSELPSYHDLVSNSPCVQPTNNENLSSSSSSSSSALPFLTGSPFSALTSSLQNANPISPFISENQETSLMGSVPYETFLQTVDDSQQLNSLINRVSELPARQNLANNSIHIQTQNNQNLNSSSSSSSSALPFPTYSPFSAFSPSPQNANQISSFLSRSVSENTNQRDFIEYKERYNFCSQSQKTSLTGNVPCEMPPQTVDDSQQPNVLMGRVSDLPAYDNLVGDSPRVQPINIENLSSSSSSSSSALPIPTGSHFSTLISSPHNANPISHSPPRSASDNINPGKFPNYKEQFNSCITKLKGQKTEMYNLVRAIHNKSDISRKQKIEIFNTILNFTETLNVYFEMNELIMIATHFKFIERFIMCISQPNSDVIKFLNEKKIHEILKKLVIQTSIFNFFEAYQKNPDQFVGGLSLFFKKFTEDYNKLHKTRYLYSVSEEDIKNGLNQFYVNFSGYKKK